MKIGVGFEITPIFVCPKFVLCGKSLVFDNLLCYYLTDEGCDLKSSDFFEKKVD